MGVAAILVMWPRPRERTNFRSPIPLRLHMKFGFDWPRSLGEDFWKWWTTVGGRWLYYKLTNEPKGSGELKTYLVGIH